MASRSEGEAIPGGDGVSWHVLQPKARELPPEMRTLLRTYICRCDFHVTARTHHAAQEALEEHWRQARCPELFDVLDNVSAIRELKIN